jgi:hypothetical protein
MGKKFEVHGYHEKEIEHNAQHGTGLSQHIAVFTAVLATLGAIISYQGSHSQTQALYYKDDAVLKHTLASTQWGYYQANSIKEHITRFEEKTTNDANLIQSLHQKVEKYAQLKKITAKQAEIYDKEATRLNKKADHLAGPNHQLSIAMTLLQIAITVASITALTRKRWLFIPAVISAVMGLVIAIWASINL